MLTDGQLAFDVTVKIGNDVKGYAEISGAALRNGTPNGTSK